VHAEVLPTSYERAGARIEALIEALKPEALLLLGLAANSAALRLERFSLNRDAAELLDNDGEQRLGSPIVAGAPDRYESTLPLERFAARVQALGCPVEFSDCAGGFVCNHVFYRACHHIATHRLPIRCGFLHLPALAPASLEPWVRAVDACLDVLQSGAR
jgi:pyroglutamyl-peptidase